MLPKCLGNLCGFERRQKTLFGVLVSHNNNLLYLVDVSTLCYSKSFTDSRGVSDPSGEVLHHISLKQRKYNTYIYIFI